MISREELDTILETARSGKTGLWGAVWAGVDQEKKHDDCKRLVEIIESSDVYGFAEGIEQISEVYKIRLSNVLYECGIDAGGKSFKELLQIVKENLKPEELVVFDANGEKISVCDTVYAEDGRRFSVAEIHGVNDVPSDLYKAPMKEPWLRFNNGFWGGASRVSKKKPETLQDVINDLLKTHSACSYLGYSSIPCDDCPAYEDDDCTDTVLDNIAERLIAIDQRIGGEK